MSRIDTNEVWDYIIGQGVATEETLQIITSINGFNVETLNDVLKVTTGFDYEQLTAERYGVTITGLGSPRLDRFLFEVEGLEDLQDSIVEVFGDEYLTVYDCSTAGEVAGYLDNTVACEELTVGTYTLSLNGEPVDPEPLYF